MRGPLLTHCRHRCIPGSSLEERKSESESEERKREKGGKEREKARFKYCAPAQ